MNIVSSFYNHIVDANELFDLQLEPESSVSSELTGKLKMTPKLLPMVYTWVNVCASC
ncbi:MAG: hypothetical protein R2757_03080 [Draconibacterium sp.]